MNYIGYAFEQHGEKGCAYFSQDLKETLEHRRLNVLGRGGGAKRDHDQVTFAQHPIGQCLQSTKKNNPHSSTKLIRWF